jgi:hypothetical protein
MLISLPSGFSRVRSCETHTGVAGHSQAVFSEVTLSDFLEILDSSLWFRSEFSELVKLVNFFNFSILRRGSFNFVASQCCDGINSSHQCCDGMNERDQ